MIPLRECNIGTEGQEQQPTRLRRQLQEGGAVSVLLIHDDADFYQGQGFRDQLVKGRRLAERLACELGPGEAAQALTTLSFTKVPGPEGLHSPTSHVWSAVKPGDMRAPDLAGWGQRRERPGWRSERSNCLLPL